MYLSIEKFIYDKSIANIILNEKKKLEKSLLKSDKIGLSTVSIPVQNSVLCSC